MIHFIDGANRLIGLAVCWLLAGLVLIELAVVLLRYVFGIGFVWLQELVLYQHAAVFMLASAYVLGRDGHVRVDVIYRGLPDRGRAIIDLVGALTCVIPIGLLMAILSYPYVRSSWMILEKSKETSGLPFVYLLKTLIPVSGILLAAQGTVMAARALAMVRNRPGT